MSVSVTPPPNNSSPVNKPAADTSGTDLMSNPQFMDLYMQNLELTMLSISANALSIVKMALDQNIEE